MNCWKTIDLQRDYGKQRLMLLSLITTLLSFVIIYLPFSLIHPESKLNDSGLVYFGLALFILLPLHKISHGVPLWAMGKKCRYEWNFSRLLIPTINFRTCESISRSVSILVFLTPTLVLTIPILFAGVLFPQYMHYCVILAALNIGLSVTDFIYLYQFVKAPRKCYIQDYSDGYDILIQNEQIKHPF